MKSFSPPHPFYVVYFLVPNISSETLVPPKIGINKFILQHRSLLVMEHGPAALCVHSIECLWYLFQDKETFHSAAAPRVISMDSYFLTEVEKVEKDHDTGRRTKRKVEQYEYDEAMEPVYRNSMFKLFVKTLEDGFFPMVVIDAVNHKVSNVVIVEGRVWFHCISY